MKNSEATRKEYSAGGVVYRQFQMPNDKYQNKYLLGKHSGYHKWVLPKGMIEAGETAEVTAVREVKEEMGVVAKIVGQEPISLEKYIFYADYKETPDMRRVMKYQEDPAFVSNSRTSARQRVEKTVKWFLMEWVSGGPQDHDWEMEEAGWFTDQEALERLAFEGEKVALRQAQGKLNK